MFGEIKALGTSRSHILGSVIIGPRKIHKNYVINFYSNMADSYNFSSKKTHMVTTLVHYLQDEKSVQQIKVKTLDFPLTCEVYI
jgi:hypothetical protein